MTFADAYCDQDSSTVSTPSTGGAVNRLRLVLAAMLLCIGTFLLSACARENDQPVVSDIEGEAGETFRLPSSLRFTVTGGENDVELRYVFSSMAIESRLYYADGTPVTPGDGIAIPAGETVTFGTEGGPRVELLGVNRVARGLDEIELNFVFSNGTEQFATAPFITPEGAQSL